MRLRSGLLAFGGLALGAVVVGWAHLSTGGTLGIFLQPEALAVVFGGTAAALLVSFPAGVLRRASTGVLHLATSRPTSLETLVPTFIEYAKVARRHGLVAVERELERTRDEFLVRALTLSMSGLPPQVVREALDIDARVHAEREEQCAQVLEAAAGYTPTLGIIGAVLGLMRVMQHFSASADVGTGIAAAFVATIFGVGTANLVFLPLATRLRERARLDGLRRELMIDGVLALRDGSSPGVVEERLAGYLTLNRPLQAVEVA